MTAEGPRRDDPSLGTSPLERLAVAMLGEHQARQACEDATGTPRGPHLERMHRFAWENLLDKREAATAAGFDISRISEFVWRDLLDKMEAVAVAMDELEGIPASGVVSS